MANYILEQESKSILKQMDRGIDREKLFCPILKVLQMRHSNLDINQAKRVVRGILK